MQYMATVCCLERGVFTASLRLERNRSVRKAKTLLLIPAKIINFARCISMHANI